MSISPDTSKNIRHKHSIMHVKTVESIFGKKGMTDFCQSLVRQVTPYYQNARISLVSLALEEITPMSYYVVRSRLDRATEILQHLVASSILPFVPVVLDGDNETRFVFPPIVEKWQNDFFLVDGTHRLFTCYHHNRHARVNVIEIEADDLPPLPCRPGNWCEIQIGNAERKLEFVLNDFEPRYFRPVTQFFNQPKFAIPRTEDTTSFLQGSIKEAL